MNKITLWFSHPNQDHSLVNKKILEQLKNEIPNISIQNLDCLYNDYQIDVDVEQKKLHHTDIIILLFPIYWVGMPALFSLWREKVFTKEFAYTDPFSQKRSVLAGKKIMIIMTLGAPENSYSKEGFIQEEWYEYTKWIDAMVLFTDMQCMGKFSFFNSRITEFQNLIVLEQRIQNFTKEIIDFLIIN